MNNVLYISIYLSMNIKFALKYTQFEKVWIILTAPVIYKKFFDFEQILNQYIEKFIF